MGVTPEIPVTGAQFTADLTGAAEVPGPGDEDGSGTASVTLNQEAGEVCFEISASNITLPASAAHIHAGSADVVGDVVVPLTPPDASGASSDCVSDVEPGLIQAILTRPTSITSTSTPATSRTAPFVASCPLNSDIRSLTFR
jgi:hypothetical protein